MSTFYRFEKPVAWDAFWAGLPEGVRPADDENDTDTYRCLTDGLNYLWVAKAEDGNVAGFEQYGVNNAHVMLAKCEDRFGPILSEHDEGFFTDEDTEGFEDEDGEEEEN